MTTTAQQIELVDIIEDDWYTPNRIECLTGISARKICESVDRNDFGINVKSHARPPEIHGKAVRHWITHNNISWQPPELAHRVAARRQREAERKQRQEQARVEESERPDRIRTERWDEFLGLLRANLEQPVVSSEDAKQMSNLLRLLSS